MPGAAEKFWDGLRRFPVALPTWIGGFTAGLISALAPRREERELLMRQRFIASWRESVKSRMSKSADDDHEAISQKGEDEELTQLRRSLGGLPRSMVATLLGNPTSAFYSQGVTAAAQSTYWHAEIWYYPTDLKHRIALAIHFDNDRVCNVERFIGPMV